MKLLRNGGFLVTCSCSQHVSPEAFQTMLEHAAHDAHVRLRILEKRGQGKDHPMLAAAPETQYLKCFITQVWR